MSISHDIKIIFSLHSTVLFAVADTAKTFFVLTLGSRSIQEIVHLCKFGNVLSYEWNKIILKQMYSNSVMFKEVKIQSCCSEVHFDSYDIQQMCLYFLVHYFSGEIDPQTAVHINRLSPKSQVTTASYSWMVFLYKNSMKTANVIWRNIYNKSC